MALSESAATTEKHPYTWGIADLGDLVSLTATIFPIKSEE